jgi:hypothetical protein
MSGTLINFGTKNPRRNLPRENRFKRAEIILQITFLRAYLTDLNYTGIGGNQFEMPGFGIADFIWATPEGKIDAFEFKVADWKKGVGQASRYRSYASRSFLVLPSKIASRAVNHIQAFHNINLGLWSFDAETGRIIRHFTPVETKPLNTQAKSAALQILNRKLKFRQLLEAN